MQNSTKGKEERLGTEKIERLLMEFSIPATIGMLVGALYNIVDRIFIGNAEELSTYGIGALTVCFPIMMIMMGLALLFGAGGAALFSIRLGERDREGAGKILGNSITMVFITQLIFMIVCLWKLESILALFGADKEIMPYAVEYMRIILFAAVLQGPAMACNNFMRADGSPKSAMVSQIIAAGFNMVFDYILIFQFHMGMTGAALATIGGQGLAAIWGMYYLIGRANVRLHIKNMKLKISLVSSVILAGLPSFFNQITSSLLNMVLNNKLLEYGGNIAISGMGAVSSIQQILTMPLVGISHGSQPIIGYNRGAGNHKRIKETLKKAIIAATVFTIIGFLVTRLLPGQLISLFGKESTLIAFGEKAITKWFLLLPVVGCQIVGSMYFQSVGKPKISLFLTMTRQVLFLIPAILIFSVIGGLDGILYAAPFADGLSFTITAIFLIFEWKRLGTK